MYLPGSERLAIRRRVWRSVLKVWVYMFQTLVIGRRRSLPVTTETASEQGEEPGGGPDGGAPHFLHGRPDGPLDEDPGEAGHAEEHGDGEEDVGDQTEKD